jgi:hypothetical protein
MHAAQEREVSSAAPLPGGAPVMPLPIIAMASFRRLMAREGHSVDLARMCVDRQYAFDCLAQAHSSAEERLRQSALALFATYDRNAAAGLTH